MTNSASFLQPANKTYSEKDLTTGILFLMKEYYVGAFCANGNEIIATFENGQRFTLSINEIKEI